jgi:uncharacterized membrane protein YdjX (TVP38/TMEM64 family)
MSISPLEPASDEEPLLPPAPAVRRLRVALLLAGTVALVVLWWAGVLSELARPDHVRQLVARAGPAAPLAFIAIQIPLNLVFLAGVPVWIAATLWPLPLAIAYSIAGTVIASTSTYLLARRFGHRWAGARVSRRLHRFEKHIERKPLRTVATLRLLLWINPGVDLLMATARVPLRDYAAGTLIGLALPTALRVAIGDVGIDALSEVVSGGGSTAWPWLGAALATLGLVAFLRYRRGNRIAAREIAALAAEEELGLTADER